MHICSRRNLLSLVAALAVVVLAAPAAFAFGTYTSGCDNCHGSFTSGEPSLHDVHQTVVFACRDCHTNTGDDPQTGSSGNYPDYSCNGCHYLGGIVLYHTTQQGAGCGCHPGPVANPENVPPYYYEGGRSGLTDPCADNLDNDGDGTRDVMDPDCAVANWEETWSTVKSLFGAE